MGNNIGSKNKNEEINEQGILIKHNSATNTSSETESSNYDILNSTNRYSNQRDDEINEKPISTTTQSTNLMTQNDNLRVTDFEDNPKYVQKLTPKLDDNPLKLDEEVYEQILEELHQNHEKISHKVVQQSLPPTSTTQKQLSVGTSNSFKDHLCETIGKNRKVFYEGAPYSHFGNFRDF